MEFRKRKFRSWSEFVGAVSAPITGPIVADHSKSNPAKKEWDLGAGWDAALEMAVTGWPEGTAAVKAYSDALVGKLFSTIRKPVFRYTINGTLGFDAARAIQGVPECGLDIAWKRARGAGKRHVKIWYNCGGSAAVSAKTLRFKGACVTALAYLLESANISTEITLCKATGTNPDPKSSRYQWEWSVPIKNFGQSFDLTRIAYCLSHPAVFRRLSFGLLERDYESHKIVGSSYGCSMEHSEASSADIYIGRSMIGEPQWANAQSCLAWLQTTLKNHGVSFK